MPHHDQQSTPLLIERHAVQYILHASLTECEDRCIGVVGCCQKGVISHALLHDMQSGALVETCNNWRENGISPCGTFSASDKRDTPDPEEIESLNSLLRQACGESAGDSLLHLLISLNTKGCLETQAFRLEGRQVIAMPLVLLEDGQTSRKS